MKIFKTDSDGDYLELRYDDPFTVTEVVDFRPDGQVRSRATFSNLRMAVGAILRRSERNIESDADEFFIALAYAETNEMRFIYDFALEDAAEIAADILKSDGRNGISPRRAIERAIHFSVESRREEFPEMDVKKFSYPVRAYFGIHD